MVGGIIALCGALSYGALARRMPESGGEYYFLSRAMHPLLGFLAGWTSLLAGFTAPIAAAALALDAYSRYAFGVTGPPELIATSIIIIAALMHGVRLGYGVWVQNLAVGLKIVLVFAFVAFGASHLPATVSPETDELESAFNFGAFAVALVWISFAYSGWNAAVYVGSEVRQPQRTLLWSLVLGTCIVTVAYLALNAIFVNAAPMDQLANRAEIGAIAAQALGGDKLRRIASGLVVLALFTSVSAMLMAGPRVYARMAEDGLFPKLFTSMGDVPLSGRCASGWARNAGCVDEPVARTARLYWFYAGVKHNLDGDCTCLTKVARGSRESADPGLSMDHFVVFASDSGRLRFHVVARTCGSTAGLRNGYIRDSNILPLTPKPGPIELK